MKTPAAVYARYSSHKQGEQSIEGQIEAAQRYADAHDLRIVATYADRAKTGRNDNRDEFQRMLHDLPRHTFSVLIVWKTDRIGRNKEEIAINKIKMKKAGVRVAYVAESVPDGPEGVIVESLLEGLAEYYSLQLSQNVRRGMRTGAEKGAFQGGSVPLGYKREKGTDGLVVDDVGAAVVRRIFREYAAGVPAVKIREELNAAGYRTSTGQPFGPSSFTTILKNRRYLGIAVFDGIEVPGAVPQIIDEETFGRVQEMVAKRKRAPASGRSGVDYLLSGKLYCGECGAPMIGDCGSSATGRVYYYYKCAARKNKKTGCTKKPVKKEWIEGVVLEKIKGLLEDDALLDHIAARAFAVYMADRADTGAIEAAKKRLKEIEAQRENLFQAILGGLKGDAVNDRMAALDEQIDAAAEEIATLQAAGRPLLTEDKIRAWLLSFRVGDADDPRVQRRMVNTFVNAIYLYDDRLVIGFNYTAPGSGDRATLTLAEADALAGEKFAFDGPWVTKARQAELFTVTPAGVFALIARV